MVQSRRCGQEALCRLDGGWVNGFKKCVGHSLLNKMTRAGAERMLQSLPSLPLRKPNPA
jgi:hypothetical protein